MVSRLLSALDTRIARTRDPLQNDCLRAERVTLLARQGRLEEARAELARIRARHTAKPNAVLTAWVCLGEGISIYFGSLDTGARDRFQRAFALSQAAQSMTVASLSAGWLAQMDFATLDFPRLLQHLPFALQNAAPDQHSAQSRACLVAAEAFHWAERFDLALPWYTRSRQHATAEGDESMLSALMHNMAWLHVAEYRRRQVAGQLPPDQTRHAKLGAESIARFDELVGIASLGSLVPVLQAQVLMLEERHAEALAILYTSADGFLRQGLDRLACVVSADIAWCELRCGHVACAQQSAARALAMIAPTTHADDRALTFARLGQISRERGNLTDAERFHIEADLAWQAHRNQQAALLPALVSALHEL